MNHLTSALPLKSVLLRVTRVALVGHVFIYAPLRWRTSATGLLFPSQCLSVFHGVGLAGFLLANAFLLASAARSLFVFYCFLFLFIISMGWYLGAGSLD